ncbi:glycosyltransferase family 2 protein [Paenalcaligenes hominis]|uniref:glycosyltransferase family 2 protein n=1 Tax=Paenalcaligenes hominis TaxID=643674 RepID=UPI003523C74C
MKNHPQESARDELWEGCWVVIPAYNEVRTIRTLVQRVLTHCPRIIVVDDGSTDGTCNQLEQLPIIILTNTLNQGKATSLRLAFKYALEHGAKCIITMDGDGQHNPNDLPRLLAVWRAWPNSIVIGSRLHDKINIPTKRYYANRTACFWISWASGHAIADTQSGFRVYPEQVMRLAISSKVKSLGFVFESEILIKAAQQGWRTVGVPIEGHYPKDARPSHFRPVADISKIVLMVAGQLLRQGMAPQGLYRSLRPPLIVDMPSDPVNKEPSFINQ